jgi:hypothetical protein
VLVRIKNDHSSLFHYITLHHQQIASHQLDNDTLSILLMNIVKRIGPKTERCGTPLITVATDEKQFTIATHCLEQTKKSSEVACQ